MPRRATGLGVLLALLTGAAVYAQQALPDRFPILRPYAPGTPQHGTGATDTRPGYATLRSDEDWSWLADPARRADPLDPLKWVALPWSDQVAMTFGGDARFSIRDFDNEAFGQGRGGNTALYVRLNPYASLQVGDRLRLFGALKYGDLAGKRVPLPPAERDRVDLHEAFAEALVHSVDGGRDDPSPGPLCDDPLATDGFRASCQQHPVQDGHADGSLGLLGSEAAGSQPWSNQRFVAAHCCFY